MSLVGVDGAWLRVNPALCQIVGYREQELLATNFQHITNPEDLAADLNYVGQMLRGEIRSYQMEKRYIHKKGHAVWICLTVSLVNNIKGEPLFFFAQIQDISEQKRTEAALRENDKRFQALLNNSPNLIFINDRASSISGLTDISERKEREQQLRQKQKMEAIGQLAGGLAHDFNNLLTVIKANNDILSSVEPGKVQRRSVEQIGKAADRATALTRQLSAFSRAQVLQPRVLDLNAVVAELSKMLPRLIGEDVEFMFVPDGRLGRVKADPGQLEQVIMNLAVNARDAMPQGGKLVVETQNFTMDDDIARRHHPAIPGPYALLTVSDTGQGMDAETQSHIFEPFFTTKKQGKGTGLGLATVYGIVKQSGGFIWVYSELGRGTTFKICLPRVDEGFDESTQPGKDSVAVVRGTETLLLVEDEEAVRELVGGFLRENGYTVLEAKNGVEGLRIAEQHSGEIHLLLTDMVMPKMGGGKLAERLVVQRPGLKVLYLSGYSEYIVAPEPDRNWRESFLQKPFSMDMLGRKLREILEKS
jgi:PAS domain S-box-containing protein